MSARFAPLMTLLFVLLAGVAEAACFADYKAKQDNPLRLHYGVVEIEGDCSAEAARQHLAPLLLADGWQLLEIVGTFDEDGLAEREEDAGEFFLRY